MDILKESEREDIIVTAYGKPMAVLHHLTEDDLADYLIKRPRLQDQNRRGIQCIFSSWRNYNRCYD